MKNSARKKIRLSYQLPLAPPPPEEPPPKLLEENKRPDELIKYIDENIGSASSHTAGNMLEGLEYPHKENILCKVWYKGCLLPFCLDFN